MTNSESNYVAIIREICAEEGIELQSFSFGLDLPPHEKRKDWLYSGLPVRAQQRFGQLHLL